ncbi:helix-turn-helix domain-containing protein [Gordonia sihwensis]|uniref:helix-turn-helix domain-containing protein n=1 Tax=Gordonia sihwensis TaxID=173559 RepID=UPI0005EFE850|nr:helix-turn-helix domain-containing protein [Gordonia sihwensis]KJR06064.1 hypothetical protein UG54_14765 [Gordonia sihwensis]
MFTTPRAPGLLRLAEITALGYPSRATLLRRIREGRLPAVDCGNHYKVTLSDVEELYPRTSAAAEALDPQLKAWAEEVVATAPPLSAADAAAVAALLVRRGGAAA